MAQPQVIVYSASDVEYVPMLSDANTFTKINTFSGGIAVTSIASISGSIYSNATNYWSGLNTWTGGSVFVSTVSVGGVIQSGATNTWSGYNLFSTLAATSTASLGGSIYSTATNYWTGMNTFRGVCFTSLVSLNAQLYSSANINVANVILPDDGYIGQPTNHILFDLNGTDLECSVGSQFKINYGSVARAYLDCNGDARFNDLISAFGGFALSSTASIGDGLTVTGTSYLGGTTNSVKIAPGGELTLEGTATRWDDERVPVTATKLGGTKDPGFTVFKKDDAGTSQGTFTYWFDKDAEEELYFSLQLPHAWKAGSTICPHVHWVPKSTATVGEYVQWGLEYTWSSIGSIYGNASIIYSNATVVADITKNGDSYMVADKHYITEINKGIPATGMGISSMLLGRLFRNSTASVDTYPADAGLLEIDFHIEIDSFGSSSEYTK